MSYRELRNFTEIMRTLGYPRLISMENFRKPNFELVADILYWMVKLYDPETAISDRVEFENERVEFLTNIANLMATKARLKLNTKKLYASDGRAVQELLKIATLLFRAVQSKSKKPEDETIPPPVKVQDVKTSRTLASDITQSGAKLFDLLSTEAVDRQERARALRFIDVAATASEGSREQQFLERSLRDIVEATKQSVEDMSKECTELEADERNMEAKIKKKQEELERTEKRLKSLDNVRPQFMEEVDKLEKELQRYYDIYIEKYRNLDYLEHELEKYHKSEEELKEQQQRRLQKMRARLLKEERDQFLGEHGRGDDDDNGRRDRNSGNNEYGGFGGGGNSRSDGRSQGNSGGGRADSDVESSDGEGSDGEGSGGDSEEELSVGSGGRGGRGGGGGGRGGAPQQRGTGGGGRGGGGGGRGGGGSDLDSDELLDDDDDDDGDGGDDDSGSDEHF